MYRLTYLQLGPHGVAQLLNTIILHQGLRCALVSVQIRSDEHTEFAGLYRRLLLSQQVCGCSCVA